MHEDEAKRHLTGLDPLTGLPDRASFVRRLAESISALRPGRPSLAVLLVDLDDFGTLCDRLGSDAGDRMLTTFAGRIVASLRRGDTAARMADDEFAVLCERLSIEEAVVDIAARLLDAIAQPVDGNEDLVTACIGIAVARSTTACPDELMRQAELALQRAKKQGRLRFHIFDPELHRRTSYDPAKIKPF